MNKLKYDDVKLSLIILLSIGSFDIGSESTALFVYAATTAVALYVVSSDSMFKLLVVHGMLFVVGE